MLPGFLVRHPVEGRAVVSSAHPLASKAGLEILAAGGNAVDAAVAVSSVLGVVEPYHSTIGGGGFAVLHVNGETAALDFRGVAPKGSHRDMFAPDGKVDIRASTEGHRSVLVPGLVDGLARMHSRYGRLDWGRLWEPAIGLASQGVLMGSVYQEITRQSVTDGRPLRFPETARVFLDNGQPYPRNKPLVQEDLAVSLRAIQREGPEVFYRGWIAARIASEMAKNGGLIGEEDLASYESRFSEPVRGTYRGFDIIAPPLPCGGGIQIIQMLNILEQFDLEALGHGSAASLGLMLKALQVGFRDRVEHLGDPSYTTIPLDRLLSKEYARQVSLDWEGGPSRPGAKGGTTHFVVADEEGNVVSWTQTIGEWYGSGVTVPGTGILLNDTMGDFAALPGTPNSHGYIYSEANGIAEGKSPLSSQTPTIVFQGGRPRIAIGAAGGPRIISAVLQGLLAVLDYGLDIREALASPRVHCHGGPAVAERSISPDTIQRLREMGIEIDYIPQGKIASWVHALTIEEGGLIQGAAEPRLEGAAMALLAASEGGMLLATPHGTWQTL